MHVCIHALWFCGFSKYRKLHHPHLSALLGVVQQTTSMTIISPLIHGSDLHNLIFSDDKVGYSKWHT